MPLVDQSGNRRRFCTSLLLVATAAAARGQTFATLASLPGGPCSPLVQGTDGSLYGTASGSTNGGAGTVFRMTPAGALTTLYSFGSKATDGVFPQAGLVQSADGNFYGTTSRGGANSGANGGSGTVFRITPAGALTTLYSFSGSDGSAPTSSLIQATDGNLYGTTSLGGAYDGGTVFRITPQGTLTTLASFSPYFVGNTSMSSQPSGLIQAKDGNFYGTTAKGGANGAASNGAVFRITPEGTLTTLYGFTGADGASPLAGVIQATDGSLYGTTSLGGTYGRGTVFKIASGNALTTLYSFGAAATDTVYPEAGLIQATDGNFYGATVGGVGVASAPDGTVFRITPAGAFSILHSFSPLASFGIGPGIVTGGGPASQLTQGTDGKLYGTASYSFSLGVYIFSLTIPPTTPSGTPAIKPSGIVPVYGSGSTIEPGSWVSIYGTNLSTWNALWNGDFPTSLGGVSVTINSRLAYLWFVSSGQINLQAPDDNATGLVSVVVTTSAGSGSAAVYLGRYAPAFSLYNDTYAAAIVPTPGAPGNSGSGYDYIGPATGLSFTARPARPGETIVLFGVGFGPTNPSVPSGSAFAGAVECIDMPTVTIGGLPAKVTFAGIVEAGLYQLNVIVPNAAGGDQALLATVGGVTTPANVFIAIQ